MGIKKAGIYTLNTTSPMNKELQNEIRSVSVFEKETKLKIFKLKLLNNSKRILHQWSLERQLKYNRWLSIVSQIRI